MCIVLLRNTYLKAATIPCVVLKLWCMASPVIIWLLWFFFSFSIINVSWGLGLSTITFLTSNLFRTGILYISYENETIKRTAANLLSEIRSPKPKVFWVCCWVSMCLVIKNLAIRLLISSYYRTVLNDCLFFPFRSIDFFDFIGTYGMVPCDFSCASEENNAADWL